MRGSVEAEIHRRTSPVRLMMKPLFFDRPGWW